MTVASPAVRRPLDACTSLDTLIERLRVNRRLTLGFLDHLRLLAAAEARQAAGDAEGESERLLAGLPAGWVDGSIGWNLLHVAVYEQGCTGRPAAAEWRRFRHGAEPGAEAAPLAEIAERLAAGRAALLARLEGWGAEGLDRPAAGAESAMTRRQVVDAAVWHEPHHLNLCNEVLRRLWFEG